MTAASFPESPIACTITLRYVPRYLGGHTCLRYYLVAHHQYPFTGGIIIVGCRANHQGPTLQRRLDVGQRCETHTIEGKLYLPTDSAEGGKAASRTTTMRQADVLLIARRESSSPLHQWRSQRLSLPE